MIIRSWCFVLAALMVLLSVVACAAPPSNNPATPVPQAAPPTLASVATATTTPKAANPTAVPVQPTAASKSVATTKGGATGKLDIDALLPPGEGRQEMLEYCVGCHNIAPIAVAGKTKDEWKYHRDMHVGRTTISEKDLDKIYNYLITYYPPDRKIPQLPPELLEDWTSY